MNDSKIPVRYSKALFELAVKNNRLDAIYSDMVALKNICALKEVRDVMANPVIASSKRREIIGAVLGKNIDPLTVRFLDLVFSEEREKHLEAMARDFIGATRKNRGIREVIITTCVPVKDSLRKEIITMVEKKLNSKVELVEKIDAGLIGGFILQVDDTFVDVSVRSRINRFKKEFAESY